MEMSSKQAKREEGMRRSAALIQKATDAVRQSSDQIDTLQLQVLIHTVAKQFIDAYYDTLTRDDAANAPKEDERDARDAFVRHVISKVKRLADEEFTNARNERLKALQSNFDTPTFNIQTTSPIVFLKLPDHFK